jgi:hypothetical protein
MNPQLDYLIATERATDLIRAGEQARLANSSRAIEPVAGRGRLTGRMFARLWLLVAGSQRLRAHRM